MNNPENGLYMAMVTDGSVTKMHADEDAVCDAQTNKLFKHRDQRIADQEQTVSDGQRVADRQIAKRKRRLWYMIKDVLSLFGTAGLVYLTNSFGLYVAIAAITGCTVAAICRITNYFEKER